MRLSWGVILGRVPLVAIVGAPRSGSTLLLRILDSHSRIAAPCEIGIPAVFPETDEKHALVVKKWGQICAYYGCDPARSERDPRILFRAILRHERKELLVLKDPRASLFIRELERYSPRYVHLVRDARSVASSRMFADPGRGYAKWLAYHESVLAFSDGSRRSVPVRLRYEDLIAGPEAEMTRLLAALDLPFEPSMLDFGDFQHADDRLKLWGPRADESPAESFLQHDLGRSIRVGKDSAIWSPAAVAEYALLPRVRELNERFGYT